jgi:hypothetical protein
LAALWFRSLVADLFTRRFLVDLRLLCFKICGEEVKSKKNLYRPGQALRVLGD